MKPGEVPAHQVGVPAVLKRYVGFDLFDTGVELFLRGGKVQQLADLWAVSRAAATAAIRSREFTRRVKELRPDVYATEAAALTSLISVALEQCEVRLREGDPHVLRDGTIIMKPVGAKDAATIASLFMDRRTDAEAQADGKQVTDRSAGAIKRLLALATALDGAHDIIHGNAPSNVIDITPKDVDDAAA